MRKLFTYLTFLLLVSLLLPSCQREWEDGRDAETTQETGEREGSWIKIHYQATASGGDGTKATLDIFHHYLFERDDLLYVVDKSTGGDELYGFMYLTAGAGATTAVFEGDLMYFVEKSAGVYEPERPANNLAITATLISATQRQGVNPIYTFVTDNDGKIDTGPNFGIGQTNDGYAATFEDAVQKYGVFKADATFGRPSFALAQQTAFLLFNLSFEDEITDSTPITVSVTNDNGAGTVLFSHEVTPNTFHQASFVVAFKGDGTVSLSNAQLRVTDTGGGALIDRTKKLADATLQGNRYYNVVKPFLDLTYFTIQARESATDIRFAPKCRVLAAGYGLQFKRNGGTWTNVTDAPADISLSAGESIIVRGKGTRYYPTYMEGSLFTSTAPCYIYGDIMSLFCDGSYNKKTYFEKEMALHRAFKDMVNLDIHPARPLLLSATTLTVSCYEETFAGSSITRAPEFASDAGDYAVDIPDKACKNMFQNCTSLTGAPELPANGSIGLEGYYGMFEGCTALETPPTRLAVTPTSKGHFQQMFKGCTSLVYSPALTATVVEEDGCRSMFEGCTSLLEAPADLPATTLGNYAYYCMFMNCSSLVKAPATLPATTVSQSACFRMFLNCTQLEEAPVISAVTLNKSSFEEMFNGCVALRTVQSSFAFSSIPSSACNKMFLNCAALNEAPNMPSVTSVASNGCFQMFRGCGQMRKAPAALTATTVGESGYREMFYGCAHILTAPTFSSTSIGVNGCQEMFRGCSRMQTPPASLSATTLGNAAYKWMFYQCSELTSIPDFPHDPAVTYVLPVGGTDKNSLCYQMFFQCNRLETLEGKKLFSSLTPMTPFCFEDMFSECRNLESVPTDFLPATTLAESCYRGMFQQTAITTAPDLLASTLVTDCYRYMFNACKSLSYIKCYTTTNVTGESYTKNWLQNAKTTGDFYYRSGVTWYTNNSHGIPSGWTPHADDVQ